MKLLYFNLYYLLGVYCLQKDNETFFESSEKLLLYEIFHSSFRHVVEFAVPHHR